MISRFNLSFLSVFLLSLVVSGCGDSTPSDPLLSGWFDVYGEACGSEPKPGCNYYKFTSGRVQKITYRNDPFFSETCSTNEDGNTSCSDDITFINRTIQYTLQGVTYTYSGYIWVSGTGIVYDIHGNALNQNRTERSRDLVGDVAAQEESVVEAAGTAFAAKYQLPLSKGIEVARALNEYAKIGTARARTEDDVREFTSRLYGVPYESFKTAILEARSGDTARAEALLAQSASEWGVSVESMKAVVQVWYGQ